MRKAFAETLAELADTDDRVLLLTADLGFMALEPFLDRHPKRFFNVGVAEQNMVGVATGLAEAGFIPFVYSIVNFATMRPFEFIRNGPVAHNLPVRIVGVGGGVEYGHNGISHYGLEDVGILRTQPGLQIICPCDAPQARSAIREVWNYAGPVYLRLGKDDRVSVPGLEGRFSLNHAETVDDGPDILLVAVGTAASATVEAGKQLRSLGIRPTVLLVSCLDSGPASHVRETMKGFRNVVTIETHYTIGGLGSWVAEIAADNAIPIRLTRLGFRGHPRGISGSQAWMEHKHGISANAISTQVATLLRSAR